MLQSSIIDALIYNTIYGSKVLYKNKVFVLSTATILFALAVLFFIIFGVSYAQNAI